MSEGELFHGGSNGKRGSWAPRSGRSFCYGGKGSIIPAWGEGMEFRGVTSGRAIPKILFHGW